MSPTDQPPRTSIRTRLLRPDLFSDDVTGTLAPATLLAYLGLSTRADDAGFLVWRPATLAAAVMPYGNPSRRGRDLERIATELVEAGLLRILPCGCGELPRMVRDLAVKGGQKSSAIRDWHLAHLPTDLSEDIQIGTDESVPASSSGSSSESLSGSSSSPGSGAGSVPDSGAARAWTDPEWLDQLHRLGMPIDRELDATWSPWLASLKRRHADREIFEVVRAVAAEGETRPALVQDLVRVALQRPARRRTSAPP